MSKNPKHHAFRANAHSADNLMVGLKEITEIQLLELARLQKIEADHLADVEAVAARGIAIDEEIEEQSLIVNGTLDNVPSSRPATEEEVEAGAQAITDATKRLVELTKEKKGLKVKARKLTPKQVLKVDELIAKRDAPLELGATAKSLIRDQYLRNEFKYREVVKTDEMDKGHINEQDAFDILDQLNALAEIRVKNTTHFESEHFKGTPDHIAKIEQIVEDVKNCFTIRTFQKADFIRLYYGQLQVYMFLTGCRRARLCYVATDTPPHIIESMKRRMMWKFGGPKELEEDAELNAQYLEVAAQIEHNHNPSKLAPIEQRCKVYQVDYDEAYIAKLQLCVEAGQRYYDTLTLVPDNLRADYLEFAPAVTPDVDTMAHIAGQIIKGDK